MPDAKQDCMSIFPTNLARRYPSKTTLLVFSGLLRYTHSMSAHLIPKIIIMCAIWPWGSWTYAVQHNNLRKLPNNIKYFIKIDIKRAILWWNVISSQLCESVQICKDNLRLHIRNSCIYVTHQHTNIVFGHSFTLICANLSLYFIWNSQFKILCF